MRYIQPILDLVRQFRAPHSNLNVFRLPIAASFQQTLQPLFGRGQKQGHRRILRL